MTGQEIIDAASACINNCCAACPLFPKKEYKNNCTEILAAEIRNAFEGGIKCSDPRITHEFGRGSVLHVTLQDEGKDAAQDLVDGYVGGYLELKAARG